MKVSKGYIKGLGLIRVLACIAILLYHMNILKGGYLAVCIFFVLTGFLSCISCFKKETFSFKDYYFNKFKNIYVPLLTTVFLSISLVSLFPNINWFNLKPETTSVLLGYNNFWQLNANMDYFARHVSSPFMHLWYMGIIIQFDLIFPFFYLILKNLGDKCNKIVSCIITGLLSIVSALIFYKSSLDSNIMFTYYSTFTRIFSIIFGVFLAFIYQYYNNVFLLSFKKQKLQKSIYYLYILIAIALCIFVDSTSKYFGLVMIIVSLLTCRLISYSYINNKKLLDLKDRFIKKISDVSYEIYLVQYPIIFIFQYINFSKYIEIFLIIFITFILSFIIKFALNFRNEKLRLVRIVTFLIILIPIIFGGYKYFTSKDYTEEMNELEQKLEVNAKIMEERKKEYAEKLRKEQEDWHSTLKDLEAGEESLKKVVSDLSIVGIGDSVMLGAIDELQAKFPNGYFDAAVSRTAYVANGIIQNLSYLGLLGEPIVINLGANGDCDEYTKDLIMNSIGNKKVFWLNVTNDYDVGVNDNLNRYASKYDNLYVIDWKSISSGHPEYFIADGIHLTSKGKTAFVKAIYDSIYNVYLEEYNKKKQDIINNYEEKQKQKITFYGNSLLINAYEGLEQKFNTAEIITNSEYGYELLKKELEVKINNNTLSNKVVLMFDKSSGLTVDNYKKIINLCAEYNLYIVSIDLDLNEIKGENVTIIDFNEEFKNNNDYYLADRIHLSEKGNNKLNELIVDIIK